MSAQQLPGSPDEALTKSILSSPPFVSVEGVINFRDLGLAASLPLAPSNTAPTSQIRPGILYRSGELTRLTPAGVKKLEELGIRAIFDFRSQSEVKKYAGQTPPLPPDSPIGIHTVPVSEKDEYDPGVLARRAAKFEKDEKEAFAELYEGIFENGRKAFGVVLRWLRDHPGEACLVHCTAGKDRTGMFAAIIQMLLDIPDAHIIHDYNLTTYGLAPALPALIARFQREALYRDKMVGVQNMGSARKETMEATLRRFRQKYGDVDSYLLSSAPGGNGSGDGEEGLGFSREDLDILRRNLRGEPLTQTVTPSGSESGVDSTMSLSWNSENEKEDGNLNVGQHTVSRSTMGSWGPRAIILLGCIIGVAATGWAYAR